MGAARPDPAANTVPGGLAADSQASDAAVIRASWANPERFGEIYDRHVAAIHRYLARRVGAPHADDLAADVFLAAFRIRTRYDVDRPDARPWLFGVATNLIRRHRRIEFAYYSALTRGGGDPVEAPDHADAVAARVAASAQAREVAGVLEKLTARERDVLLLLAWAELSYDEIAAALNIPVGTVRSRLNRARTRLRGALGETTLPIDTRNAA